MPPLLVALPAIAAFAAANAGTIAAVGTVAAGTAVSALAASRQGAVAGDTAMVNARLRAKEQISQAQMSEYEAQVREQQALVGERQATLSDRAAATEREYTADDVMRQRVQARAFQAEQRAAVGGSGLEATGSPLNVMAETAHQLELDRLVTTHEGEMRAQAHEEEARLGREDATMARHGAELARYTARQQRQGIPLGLNIGRYQARASRQAGQLGAVSALIGGATRGVGAYYGARG
jgi:hypothetical protein